MKKLLGIIFFAFILLLAGCARPPEPPAVTGVTEGGIYPSAVTITVVPQERAEYSAAIDDEPYILGSPYTEEGIHTLRVTATHTRNGLTSESTLRFEIDTEPPVTPVIDGVADGGVYFQSIQAVIHPESGVTYDSAIDGVPYQIGAAYTQAGDHVLTVTARKDRNGLTSQRQIRFTIENRTYTRDEVDYFLEIALGTEYGGEAPVRKWTEDIRIKVNGDPTDVDREKLDDVMAQLRELTGLGIEIVEDQENINIYYIPDSEFIEYIPSYVEGNWGYFSYNVRGDGEIWQAKIGIDTVKTNQFSRSHLLQEELTQALGMGNDSYEYEDSIFYQEWTLTQDYSDMDKAVIEILYRDDISVGMDKKDILEVLAPRIVD